jgi:spore maturation protein CgeB
MTWIGAGPLSTEIDPGCEFVKKYWNVKALSHADYLKYMVSAAVSLNLNKPSESLSGAARSLNARAYETAAIGVFTIHDDTRSELKTLFGEAAVTFRTVDEAYDKIVYYGRTEDIRQGRISAAQKIITDHTYEARVKKLLWCLQQPKV